MSSTSTDVAVLAVSGSAQRHKCVSTCWAETR